ncbi:ArnT family glycosyltransferase [Desulfocicer vacuolatum]|nr:glycosyltransferase family 39 protein [Desulfocicer vacuolatum]
MFIGAYPLADTTEARYGEMGRLMLETGDWITPQFEKGIPFWGKPPLSFWLTAASFKLLGIHEFSARLPSFLLGIAVVAMVFNLGKYRLDQKNALIACVIMTSSIIFWISSGAVMTDHCLLAGTTLSMVGFWRCITAAKNTGRIWGILFFMGLSIGLMAKGPVAVVLIFFPVLSWCLIPKRMNLILKLPWLTGMGLTLLLSLPWYVAAELKTPGFLEYFIVGEHWNRFLVSGWKGDLYGSAHAQPKGMIWAFWVVCAFPWSIFLPLLLMKKKNRNLFTATVRESQSWFLYLVLWATTPMVFFTMAGNILWAYVLPGIPAFSLVIAGLIHRQSWAQNIVQKIACIILTLFLSVSIVVVTEIGPDLNSQKKLLGYFNRISHGENLYYFNWRPFSAEFYSRAAVGEIISVFDIKDLFEDNQKSYLAVKNKHVMIIPKDIMSSFDIKKKINGYVLFQEK